MRLELKCIQCGCQRWQRLRNEKIAGSQNITAPKKGLSEQLRTSCTTKLKQWHRRSLNIFPGPCTMEFPQGQKQILLFSPTDSSGQRLCERGWNGKDKSLMHRARQRRTGWGICNIYGKIIQESINLRSPLLKTRDKQWHNAAINLGYLLWSSVFAKAKESLLTNLITLINFC